MRALITGGLGFIGSHLARKLVEEGHKVSVIDNLSSGAADVNNLGNVKDDVDWVIDTIVKSEIVERWARNTDVIFHLATQCLVMGMDHPKLMHETNDVGTFNVCMAAKEYGCKVVYISTSEVYGNQDVFPIKEDAPLRPSSLYALTKVIGENYVRFFHETYDVPAVIIRPFNCYDEETEVLTDEGFKKFANLTGNEFIATLNQKTNCLEYQMPTNHVSIQYQGEMVRVKSPQLDLLVTPNHRMWVRKRWEKQYRIMEARELVKYQGKRAITFQLSADWKGQKSEFKLQKMKQERVERGFSEKRYIDAYYNFDLRDWVKFLAWFLSEGYTTRSKTSYIVGIRQTSSLPNLEEIFDLAKKLGFHALKRKDGRVLIFDKALYLYLRQFGKAKDKFVPQNVKNLPKELIEDFVKVYRKGDGFSASYSGYQRSNGIVSYSSRMLNDLQELCLKTGWASSLDMNSQHVTIAEKRTEVCPRQSDNFTFEKYSGMIYCVTVPNEIIFVRRKGKGVFCGNTFGPLQREDLNMERLMKGFNAYAGVITTFIKRCEKKEAPIIFGDGLQSRDFSYVSDIVDGIILLSKLWDCEVVNLGSGIDYSVSDVASWVGSIWGLVVTPVYAPPRLNDIRKLLADISLAKGYGYEPKVSFEQGLTRYIEWYKKVRKGME